LRRLVAAQSLQIRDQDSRWSGQASALPAVESIVLDVPGTERGAVLEATFGAGASIGDWDFQILGAAAHLSALVLEIERLRLEVVRGGLGQAPKKCRDEVLPLIGHAPAILALRKEIDRIAATDFTVLIEGESGVGKELVARQIHELSRRRSGPFVAINCAALVETLLEAELFGIEDRTATGVRGRRGKFEQADGGTLFLDEVGDLSPSAQAKLLRAIQDLSVTRVGGQGTHRVNIRIVAATNRPLGNLVERQLFRPDLFFRLAGVDVRVPSLRERRPDVVELALHFIDRHRTIRQLRLSAGAADALTAYDWPGNVRELERLMERAVALTTSDVIGVEDLPPKVRGDAGAMIQALESNRTLRAWSSRYARLVLDRANGNKREACRVLGISYHTLNAYLRYPLTALRGVAEAWDAPTGNGNMPQASESVDRPGM
jgi:transcriptional regulator with PAS, ATPase and Fis domain